MQALPPRLPPALRATNYYAGNPFKELHPPSSILQGAKFSLWARLCRRTSPALFIPLLFVEGSRVLSFQRRNCQSFLAPLCPRCCSNPEKETVLQSIVRAAAGRFLRTNCRLGDDKKLPKVCRNFEGLHAGENAPLINFDH